MKFEAAASGSVRLLGDRSSEIGLNLVLPLKVSVKIERRPDRLMRIQSLPDGDWIEYQLGQEPATDAWWGDLPKITKALLNTQYRFQGFDLRYHSGISTAADLGQSSAFMAATLKALRSAYEFAMTDIEIARFISMLEPGSLSSAAVLASTIGRPGEALLAASGSYEFERFLVPKELFDLTIVAIEPGVERDGGTDKEATLKGVHALRERDVKRFGAILFEGQQSQSEGDESVRALLRIAKTMPEIIGLRVLAPEGLLVLLTTPRAGINIADDFGRALRSADPEIRLRPVWP